MTVVYEPIIKKSNVKQARRWKRNFEFLHFPESITQGSHEITIEIENPETIEEVVVTMDRIETFKKIDKYPKNQLEQ